jgi:hypothetical protein
MAEQEMLDYLLSTGLYEKGSTRRPYKNMFCEKRMLCTDDTIPIKDLVKRFIKMDKYRNGQPWNIRQILANIDIIIPVENRK